MFIDDYSRPANKLPSDRGAAVFAFLLPFRARHETLDPPRLLGPFRHALKPERERCRELLL
jgi:hypothetical protein